MRYDAKRRDPFYATAAWKKIRVMALQRDHYWCRRCGKRHATTVHHLVPISADRERALDLDNLESVCAVCHNQIHDEKGRKDSGDAGMPDGFRVVEVK